MIATIKKLRPKPFVLAILDGFGIAPPSRGNAISLAQMPTWNSLIRQYPTMALHASGEEVGLRWGEMGNSEVGHLNIGTGRVSYQSMMKISHEIQTGSFFQNKELLKACSFVRKNKSRLHCIGLLSNASVHSFDEHLYSLFDLAKQEKISKVFLHIFLDGRDAPYNSGAEFIKKLEDRIRSVKGVEIATLSGRFYAMDRDNRWDRIQKAYEVMIGKDVSSAFFSAQEAMEHYYQKGIYDEEFLPTVIVDGEQKPVGSIRDGDGVICFNFRADRMRQIVKAFVLPGFEKFERAHMRNLFFVTFTEYDPNLPVSVAFPYKEVEHPLAEILSKAHLAQLHIAETEKYAHVTYFFNGGARKVFPGERDILIPSLGVPNYAKYPKMSALEITDFVVKSIQKDEHDFIVINYANPDMVSHTGNLEASVKALECIDGCIKDLVNAVLSKNGAMIITADHGNIEEVVKVQTGMIDKEHSTSPVPFVLIGSEWEGKTAGLLDIPSSDLSLLPPQGMLSDIAPTILKILGLKQPKEMLGQPLV